MIRPSSLYRSDSRRAPTLEAHANNISEDSIDCGVTALRCCNTPGCQKMANKKSFLIVLIACGLIQSAIESYFRISAKQAALSHEYDQRIIDWLLVASGIFQGIFAIFVGYWGNRIHRTGWLGGIFMLQSFMCILIIIPTLVHHSEDNDTLGAIEVSTLCIRHRSENLVSTNFHSTTTLVLLFVLQLAIALGTIAYFTLGFSYLDDNVHEHESPAFLAAALAAKFLGTQLGPFVSLIVGFTEFGWFLGWIILAPILFIIGFIAVMFPKKLLSTVVRLAANSILETSTNASHASLSNRKFIADISFFPSLARVITNKLVLLNVLAAVFVQTAIINFFRHESNYLQSRFFLPTSEADGLNNEWTSQLVAQLLKPPILSLAILVSGLIISKANPSPRKIVVWNIIACCIVVTFFILSIFIDCEKSTIAGSHRGKIVKPYCAHSCLCSDNQPFMPVCPENSVQTFYSPCFAGCGSEILINDVRVFGNCSCGADTELPMVDSIATVGACGMTECQKYWITFQVMAVVAASLIASTLIGKLIILIRSVLPQDKSLAIAFELSLVGLIVFFPGKMAYRFIADHTCAYFAPDEFRCFLHDSEFGTYINILTAGLILIGVIFEALLLCTVGDLFLYGDESDNADIYRPIEMNTYRNGDSIPVPPPVEPENPSQNAPLLQNEEESAPPPPPARQLIMPMPFPPSGVTYAQIQRHNALNNNSDALDFSMQTPRSDNGSVLSDYRSVASSGYVNVNTLLYQQQQQQPNHVYMRSGNRPQSPETSF